MEAKADWGWEKRSSGGGRMTWECTQQEKTQERPKIKTCL